MFYSVVSIDPNPGGGQRRGEEGGTRFMFFASRSGSLPFSTAVALGCSSPPSCDFLENLKGLRAWFHASLMHVEKRAKKQSGAGRPGFVGVRGLVSNEDGTHDDDYYRE